MEIHLKIADNLTKLLDREFKILGFKFGLDPIFGLIPILGDVLPVGLTIYIIWIAKKLKLPNILIVKILAISLLDVTLGMIPILGDLFDFVFRANVKNLKLLKDYIESQEK